MKSLQDFEQKSDMIVLSFQLFTLLCVENILEGEEEAEIT